MGRILLVWFEEGAAMAALLLEHRCRASSHANLSDLVGESLGLLCLEHFCSRPSFLSAFRIGASYHTHALRFEGSPFLPFRLPVSGNDHEFVEQSEECHKYAGSASD